MFELGMRLAFDKPTIIIKDDCTSYSFDTSLIEHLEYPRDLNYSKINVFKAKLAAKIKTQLEAANKDGAYSPFLKNFGEFKVAKLDQKEVSGQDYIVGKLEEISRKIGLLESRSNILFSGGREEKDKSALVLRKEIPIFLSDLELNYLGADLLMYYNINLFKVDKSKKDQHILCLSSYEHSNSFINRVIDAELNIIQQ